MKLKKLKCNYQLYILLLEVQNNISNTSTQIIISNDQNNSQNSFPKRNINDIDQLHKELGIIHFFILFCLHLLN